MTTMIPYVVRPGDYLTRIAARRGFDPKTVWDDPKNADLKKRRPNPEVLAAGDILYVPEEKPKKNPLTIGGTNSFKARLPRVKVKVVLNGSDGKPLANAKYWVDGEEAGTTAGDGKVEIEVRPTQTSVSLRVEGCPDTYLLRVAHLDPIDTDAGVRQRLVNLRYLPESSAHVTPAQLADALRRFQQQNGLSPTGVADDDTRQKLVSANGS